VPMTSEPLTGTHAANGNGHKTKGNFRGNQAWFRALEGLRRKCEPTTIERVQKTSEVRARKAAKGRQGKPGKLSSLSS